MCVWGGGEVGGGGAVGGGIGWARWLVPNAVVGMRQEGAVTRGGWGGVGESTPVRGGSRTRCDAVRVCHRINLCET